MYLYLRLGNYKFQYRDLLNTMFRVICDPLNKVTWSFKSKSHTLQLKVSHGLMNHVQVVTMLPGAWGINPCGAPRRASCYSIAVK